MNTIMTNVAIHMAPAGGGGGIVTWITEWQGVIKVVGAAIIIIVAILFAYKNVIDAVKYASKKEWKSMGKELGAVAAVALIAGVSVVGLFALINSVAPDVLPSGTSFTPVTP